MPELNPRLEIISDQARGPLYQINLDTPALGGKCYLIESKGMFIMERGPALLRTIACTHAGAGSLAAFDGVPDRGAFFPDRNLVPPPPLGDDDQAALMRYYSGGGALSRRVQDWMQDQRRYDTRNGRPLYRATPTVMGSWMLDAGCIHGLTLLAIGGRQEVNAVASVVWQPGPVRKVSK